MLKTGLLSKTGPRSARISEVERKEKSTMKMNRFLLEASVLIALPIASAGAGPCTIEIENLAKQLASHDAGAGPTTGAAGSRTLQHPPTAAMSAADPSTAESSTAAKSPQPQHPPTAAMNEAAQGGRPSTQAPTREQHPPTAAMGQATQGGAASPQDVQNQNRGGPTAAQQAEGVRRPAPDNLASAQSALGQARGHDQAGREAECMDAIQRAKRLAG